ncbi:hypothetical protein A4X09_0g3602 [Tilletia walkeri]|uniref:Uncharacterized protein n=1 Tax=Tilletia walkeri TaxID=117179 RepID=A0A8X7T4S6_9BASI|nr:hypothetical protein A4X09_0g3602 [Tilletia walkeri]
MDLPAQHLNTYAVHSPAAWASSMQGLQFPWGQPSMLGQHSMSSPPLTPGASSISRVPSMLGPSMIQGPASMPGTGASVHPIYLARAAEVLAASMANTSSASPAPSSASIVPPSDALYHGAFKTQLLDNTGKPMHLYAIKYSDDGAVHAYVEAKEGEQFSVLVNSTCPVSTYATFLYLGPQCISRFVASPSQWPFHIKGRRISENEEESLIFAKPVFTDSEADSIRDRTQIARLGEVCIVVARVTHMVPAATQSYSHAPIGPEKAIYERSKAIGGVQFGTGPTIRTPPVHQMECTSDPTFQPLRFFCHCSTRIGLELAGIIPKQTTAIPPKKRSREERSLRRRNVVFRKRLRI